MTTVLQAASPIVAFGPVKMRIFVDFWNFQLTLNEETSSSFKIDWVKMPSVLVQEAARMLSLSQYSYEGTIVFTSYDPKKDRAYHKWVTSWLDRQVGMQVKCFERRAKHAPKCPTCHAPVHVCPTCGAGMAGTTEKGVDTAIATDMIRLAWEDAYDVAILGSADADLVPAVEFIDLKGKRVIQAGFPPHGSHLSRACWATMDVSRLCQQFER